MGRPPIGKTAMTDAERMRRYRLKRSKDKPVTKPVTKPAGADDTDLIAAIKAELAQVQTRIAELEDENHAFRVELESQSHVIKTRDGGGLTKAQYGMLLKVFHPDNPASEQTRNVCIRLMHQLRYVLCNEAELPSMDPSKFHISFQKLWKRRQETIKRAKKHHQRRGQPKASRGSPKNLSKT